MFVYEIDCFFCFDVVVGSCCCVGCVIGGVVYCGVGCGYWWLYWVCVLV